jgi:hypothetical protein
MPLLALLLLAAAAVALWWHRRRRADALLKELGSALALAAEAQTVCWRLDRRYTDEIGELARMRRDLAPYVEQRKDCRWELGTSEDATSFDLAILAIPVRGPLRLFGKGKTLGYQRLLTAHGDHGVIAYDSFAEDERYLPRQPQRASALA